MPVGHFLKINSLILILTDSGRLEKRAEDSHGHEEDSHGHGAEGAASTAAVSDIARPGGALFSSASLLSYKPLV